ncbi:GGDEF domain-containing protein, partial [Salinisphaera sp. T5B8]|uniref:GGDEF domain-containing protein n=1 Tax=Salinisphaera sp. T5B8 TaxID=1304154 RepID=UPI00333FF78C
MRAFVRRVGVWRATAVVTFVTTLVAFAVTGISMELAGLPHGAIGYVIALACSLTIMPAIMPAMMLTLLSLIKRLDVAEHELYRLARTDELTGLPNRRVLFEVANRELNADTPVALLFIDIDHFKQVNDTYGHRVGDIILCRVAKAIDRALHANGVLCRFGGEEFASLLRDTTPQRAQEIAEALRRHIQHMPITIGGDTLHVTLSIGIATASAPRASHIAALIDQADKANKQHPFCKFAILTLA